MAYKSTPSSSSSFHDMSSLSGVPVVVNPKFKPPDKVTLPLNLETSFRNQNPSEVLFMEYNFELEEQIIKWSESYRQSQKAQNQAVIRKVGADIEKWSRQQDDESLSETTDHPKSDVNHSTHQVDTSSVEGLGGNHAERDLAMQSALPAKLPAEVNPPSVSSAQHTSQINPLLQSMGTDILVPMQATAKSQSPQEVNGQTVSKESFDIADFERVQDPFDTAELRVMNDMEELNKVLQNVQSSASKPHADNSATNQTHPSQGQNAPVDLTFGVTPAAPSESQTSHPKSIKEIDYPELDSLDTSESLDQAAVSYPSATASAASASNVPGVGAQSSFLPQKPYLPTVSSYPTIQGSVAGQTNNNNPFVQTSSVSNSFSASNPFSAPQTNNLFGPSPSQANVPADFVSRGNPFSNSAVQYSKQSDTASLFQVSGAMGGNFHGNVATTTNFPPTATQNGPNLSGLPSQAAVGASAVYKPMPPVGEALSTKSLRSCRSTPDIPALTDKATIPFPSSHTPPPNTQVQKAYIDRQKHHQNTFSETNPWGSYPSKSSASAVSQTTTSAPSASQSSSGGSPGPWNGYSHQKNTPRPSPQASKFPDPYHSMNKESQGLVDQITAMGFSRACVARTVQKLGTDDKQVVDFLCLVTRLSEKGFALDDVEVALPLFENKEEKTEEYLQSLSRLSELGFSKDKIKDALLSSELDEHKALDILTGNS